MLYQIDGGKAYSGVYYYSDGKRIREERKNDTLVWADDVPQFAKRHEAQEPNELGRVEPREGIMNKAAGELAFSDLTES